MDTIDPEVVFPEDEIRKEKRKRKISTVKLATAIWLAAVAIEIYKKGCLFWVLLGILILVIIFM